MTQNTNNPPPAAELFKEEIESLRERANAFGEITEANAGDASDLVKLASQLSKDIDTKRAEEKKPHLEAGRQIDGLYGPLVQEAKACTKKLESALTRYIVEERRKAEERRIAAEREEREAAERAAALADDALLGEDALKQAKAAQDEAKLVAAEEKQAANVKGSAGFRASGLRTTRKAKVTDWPALVQHFHQHPDVQAAAEKAANAFIRAAKGGPVNIPGIEIDEITSLS